MLSQAAPLLARRSDWIEAGKRLILPYIEAIETGDSQDMPVSTARPFAQWLELFVRPMTLGAGLVMTESPCLLKLKNGKMIDLAAWYRDQITRGMLGQNRDRWSLAEKPMEQSIVETAFLAVCLVHSKSVIWDLLSDEVKQNLTAWMHATSLQMTTSINNWNLFPILTQLALKQLGMPWNEPYVRALLDETEKFYHGDGWYADGYYRQFDYYVPEEIYQLLVAAKWLGENSFTQRIHHRAERFSRDFRLFFDSEGRNICFGRSRSYKSSASLFFATCAFCEVPGVDMGLCRSIVRKNLSWFLSRPVFSADGRLAAGFGYMNERLNEVYFGPGSYAWAYQSFLPLLLPETHPFWTSREPEGNPSDIQSYLPRPNFIVTVNSSGDNSTLYNGGSHHPFDAGDYAAKYGKFAYSSHFGFNLSGRGQSFDNMICLQPVSASSFWSHRIRFEICENQDNWLISRHQPFEWNDKTVATTALTVHGPWHVRAHLLELNEPCRVREGGSPVTPQRVGIYLQPVCTMQEHSLIMEGENGTSAGFSLFGGLSPDWSEFTNVNVLYRRVCVPCLTGTLAAGTHLIVSAWYAESQTAAETQEILPPALEQLSDSSLQILWSDGQKDMLTLKKSSGPLKILAGGGTPLKTKNVLFAESDDRKPSA